jgi:type IV secretory pathway TrbL component
MMGCRNRKSFRNLFEIINILPFKSRYILTFLVFVVNNNYFTLNTGNYNILAKEINLHLRQGKYSSFLKRSLLFGNQNF